MVETEDADTECTERGCCMFCAIHAVCLCMCVCISAHAKMCMMLTWNVQFRAGGVCWRLRLQSQSVALGKGLIVHFFALCKETHY